MMKLTKSCSLIVLLPLVALLNGCASAPVNPQLTDARNELAKAQNDTGVYQNAPVALTEAEEAVAKADALQKAGANEDDVTHAAYLAYRRVQIAEEKAKIAQAQKAVADAEAERQQVLLESRERQAQRERDRAEGLSKQLGELQAKQTARGAVLTLGDVLFDVGHAELKPGAFRTMDNLADFMRQNPQRKVRIEGYTDSTGSADFNQQLSESRARAVQLQLIQRNIASDRIEVAGYGVLYPVASNATASGRQLNRRVEIVISDPSGNIPRR